MQDRINYIKEAFGFDFCVTAKNDLSIGCVRIYDNYGEFIPVPFRMWNAVINEKYHPLVMQNYPGIHPQAAYEQAIIVYCRQFQHCYIGLN